MRKNLQPHRLSHYLTAIVGSTWLLAPPAANATFFIVAFDARTLELGSATATCLSDSDLGSLLSRFAPTLVC